MVVLIRDFTRARVDGAARTLAADPGVGRVATWYQLHDPTLRSNDGRSTYVIGWLKKSADDSKTADRVIRDFRGQPGVKVGGQALAQRQAGKTVQEDLARAELLALPLLFLLSLWFFRSGVAAVLPPLMGGLSIVLTFLGLRIASEFMSMSIFAINLVTGLGLGLAIDYSLFMVSRYREEPARRGRRARRCAHAEHRRPHGAVQLADRRGRARLAARVPAALPLLDGRRRRAGGAPVGERRAGRAHGSAGRCSARA